MIKNLFFVIFFSLLTSCTTPVPPQNVGFTQTENLFTAKGLQEEISNDANGKSDIYFYTNDICGFKTAAIILSEISQNPKEEKENLTNKNRHKILPLLKKQLGKGFKSLKISHQANINSSPKGMRFHVAFTDKRNDKIYTIIAMRDTQTNIMLATSRALTPQNALSAYNIIPTSAFSALSNNKKGPLSRPLFTFKNQMA